MARGQVDYTLLEPLMDEALESGQDVDFKPNRRDPRVTLSANTRSEQCNRVRLFILVVLAFILVYVSLGVTREDLPQAIVRVPPDDNGGEWPTTCLPSGAVRLISPFVLFGHRQK